ncbi:MAG: hypothetical protein HUU43_05695 [Ignavibacteriaceae bacterium]|nr:hypothetical protein [Ignavibacteriaceae bacterium]
METLTNINLWGIILAGGEGTRLRDFIKKIYGYDRPKQFCTIIGNRSMVRQTLDRAKKIISPGKIITVVNQAHDRFIQEEFTNDGYANLLYQPRPRETTAGILFPLFEIVNRSSGAIAVIFPSDHFIAEEEKFINHLKDAVKFCASHPDRIVLLGIRAHNREKGYGWIEKGDVITHSSDNAVYRVAHFWEKPQKKLLNKVYNDGCLWNTFIVIGSVRNLIHKIKMTVPEVFNPFNRYFESCQRGGPHSHLKDVFDSIPTMNFSESVLQQISEILAVFEIPDVYWSDWGDEHRIRKDVERFKLECTLPRGRFRPGVHEYNKGHLKLS